MHLSDYSSILCLSSLPSFLSCCLIDQNLAPVNLRYLWQCYVPRKSLAHSLSLAHYFLSPAALRRVNAPQVAQDLMDPSYEHFSRLYGLGKNQHFLNHFHLALFYPSPFYQQPKVVFQSGVVALLLPCFIRMGIWPPPKSI